jgi:ribose 5-phosphate isomerase A
VARAARRFIVIADAGKRVATLGAFPLPVEVVPFAWEVTAERVGGVAGAGPELRRDGEQPVVTDNGNYILDCRCGRIADPARLERELKLLPGVVECGLFVGMAELAVVSDGETTELIRAES